MHLSLPQLRPAVRRFVADESGVDLLEFAFLGGLIGTSAVLAMKDLRADVLNAGHSIWVSVTSDF